MWALGRAAFPAALQSQDLPYVSASNIPIPDRPDTDPAPRPLTVEEIEEYHQYYATAASNAVHKAGSRLARPTSAVFLSKESVGGIALFRRCIASVATWRKHEQHL